MVRAKGVLLSNEHSHDRSRRNYLGRQSFWQWIVKCRRLAVKMETNQSFEVSLPIA